MFGLIALYVFSTSSQNILTQSIYVLVTFLPLIAGFLVIKINGISSSYGKTFLLLTIGYGFWTFAECLWYVFNFFLNIDPYPSIADFFFLVPYPLFFMALLMAYKSSGAKMLHSSKKVLLLDLCIVLTLSVLVAYFGMYKAYDSELGSVENALSMGYGFVDLVLVVISLFTVSIAREFKNGRFGAFWISITAGFTMFLVADVLFAIYNPEHSQDMKPYTFIDLFWIAGYLCLSYAMFDIGLYLRQLHKSVSEEITGKTI
jgi:hypothetical protein